MIFYNRSGTQTGETFELDSKLSDQEKAAVAKSTGDAISDCYDKLDPEVWKDRIPYGYISEYGMYSGTINDSGAYVPGTSGVVSDYIPVSAGKVYTIRDSICVYSYDSSKQYISKTSNYPKNFVCPSGTAFVRITASNADKNVVRIVETEHFGDQNINGYVYTGTTSASDELIRKGIESFADRNSFYFAKSKNQFNYETDWVQFSDNGKGLVKADGTFVYSDGSDKSNAFSPNLSVCPVKYFELEEGQTLTANRSWSYGCFYNSSKEFIGSINERSSAHPSIVAPSGCAYARIAFKPILTIYVAVSYAF